MTLATRPYRLILPILTLIFAVLCSTKSASAETPVLLDNDSLFEASSKLFQLKGRTSQKMMDRIFAGYYKPNLLNTVDEQLLSDIIEYGEQVNAICLKYMGKPVFGNDRFEEGAGDFWFQGNKLMFELPTLIDFMEEVEKHDISRTNIKDAYHFLFQIKLEKTLLDRAQNDCFDMLAVADVQSGASDTNLQPLVTGDRGGLAVENLVSDDDSCSKDIQQLTDELGELTADFVTAREVYYNFLAAAAQNQGQIPQSMLIKGNQTTPYKDAVTDLKAAAADLKAGVTRYNAEYKKQNCSPDKTATDQETDTSDSPDSSQSSSTLRQDQGYFGESYNWDRLSVVVEANISFLFSNDIKVSVADGFADAGSDGFSGTSFADNDDFAISPRVGVTYDIKGDGASRGTRGVSLYASYAEYSFLGGFDVDAGPFSAVSRGSQEIDVWQIDAGYYFFPADQFSVEFILGYMDLDITDRSELQFFNQNLPVGVQSNSENLSDSSATFGLEVDYHLGGNFKGWTVGAGYREGFGKVGFNRLTARDYRVTVGFRF